MGSSLVRRLAPVGAVPAEAEDAGVRPPISARLKRREGVIADRFPEATVLFADIEGFTQRAASLQPEQVVDPLDNAFSAFDRLVEQRGLEKIQDHRGYLHGGRQHPDPPGGPSEVVADLALAMPEACDGLRDGMRLRIGIDTGRVAAGVIGRRRFIYGLWGTP